MLRKVFNLVLITFLLTIFASCSKCKDCQISYETLNNYSMSDLNDGDKLSYELETGENGKVSAINLQKA